MTVRIKVCGITNEEDALTAAELGADAIGFIFAPSPRRITPERAREIIGVLPPLVITVGVFVDEKAEEVARTASFCPLDVLQFHGDETSAYCRRFDIRVIKAVRVRSEEDLEVLPEYGEVVDGFLLDTYVPNQRGGTGQIFDWNLGLKAKKHGRIILAGGLNPKNVAAAIERVRPYGVDASSGLEIEVGVKDHKKIAEFIENAHMAASKMRSKYGY